MSTPPLPAGYQLIQPGQASAPPPLPTGYRLIPQPGPGEQINDVGNKVIVPSAGEDFGQTMKRAAAYGKTVTPDQINAEVQSAPQKVGATLAAAPAIGFGGTAALAGAGMGPQIAQALVSIAKKFGIRALEGAGLGYGYHLYKELKSVFEPEQ